MLVVVLLNNINQLLANFYTCFLLSNTIIFFCSISVFLIHKTCSQIPAAPCNPSLKDVAFKWQQVFSHPKSFSSKRGKINIRMNIHYYFFVVLEKYFTFICMFIHPINWGCRIHRLHLCRGVRLPQRVAQSARAAEYTDYICEESKTPLQLVSWVWH